MGGFDRNGSLDLAKMRAAAGVCEANNDDSTCRHSDSPPALLIAP
jgi:hypothetical protein